MILTCLVNCATKPENLLDPTSASQTVRRTLAQGGNILFSQIKLLDATLSTLPLQHSWTIHMWHLECRDAITLVDYSSNWVEVAFTSTITTEVIAAFLSAVFR